MSDLFVYDVDNNISYLIDHPQPRRFSSPSSDVVLLDGPPPPHKNQDQLASSSHSQDLFKEYSPRILEIVPDVDHDHLRKLLDQYQNSENSEQHIQFVLHALLEDASYPRNPMLKVVGKRRRSSDETDERATRRLKPDPSSMDRPVPSGSNYFPLALQQLQIDYPYIPKQHIRFVLAHNRGLYSPSYFFLENESKNERLPYRLKSTAFRPSGKDRALYDPDFQIEREWLINHLNAKDEKATPGGKIADEEEEEDSECEDGIDCACCFSKYAFDRMVQCPEAHLFCRTCCRRYAATQLGQHDHQLLCMDQSGCKQPFPDSELARFLSTKLLQLYHRLKQQEEVAEASLEGLEECPFCEYKVVIENLDERLFRCVNEDCMAITCRQCKKLDHLPKSCKEADSDATLDIRHTLEEAMSKQSRTLRNRLMLSLAKAMMRNCPKCKKSGATRLLVTNVVLFLVISVDKLSRDMIIFTKTLQTTAILEGRLLQKYVTFFVIVFHLLNGIRQCLLWDPVEVRHDEEVRVVAEKLKKQLKEQNPDLPEDALNVDIPKPKNHPQTKSERHGRNTGIPPPQGMQYHQGIHFQVPGNLLNPQHNVPNQLVAMRARLPRQDGPGQRAYVGWQRLPELPGGPPLPHIPLGPPQERNRRRR